MLSVPIAVAGVALILWFGEIMEHHLDLHPEITRKFIHITVATFAAAWPLFMTPGEIMFMSVLLFLGVVATKRIAFFDAIYKIKRITWGEIFFPVSIGLAALISLNPWVYSAAMLHLGLADGLAAISGTLFGAKHRYKVLGATKSRAGTITFWVCSFLIILFCAVLNGPKDSFLVLLWLPLVATLFENVGVAGADNIMVPMLIVLAL